METSGGGARQEAVCMLSEQNLSRTCYEALGQSIKADRCARRDECTNTGLGSQVRSEKRTTRRSPTIRFRRAKGRDGAMRRR
ncbi:hypothetical protein IG631_07323 [Alternaria alternata]|nr:hypothetical protein IG631_07323 [Alternaria alternata]